MADDNLVEVPQRHSFDASSLHRYLTKILPNYSCRSGRISVRQFKHGESNPTFHLLTDTGQEYVLRKRPTGDLLPGAHRVDREYQILSALYRINFPVPHPLIHCRDTSVIGTEFYIMEYVRGRVFRDAMLPGVPREERTLMYQSYIDTLAQLHNVDWAKIGLTGYGSRSKRTHCERQVSVWSNNYKMACIDDEPSPEMTQLMEWLPKNIPTSEHPLTIVHGDYRIQNVMFHPTEPRIVAVLDWELSALGHPLVDVAHACLIYSNPLTCDGALGIPTEDVFVKQYTRKASLIHSLSHWPFFKALANFRMAAIAQGVYARGKHGNSSRSITSIFKHSVRPLARNGCVAIRPDSVPVVPLPPHLDFVHYSDKARQVLARVKEFMNDYIYPNEEEMRKHVSDPTTMWTIPPLIEGLKEAAIQAGFFNLFLPAASGLTQLEYAPIAEELGRSIFASEVLNCSAPDTGNMEVLHLYGSKEQKAQWLQPLLEGRIRSCFSMTEPDVASSDASNMECTITKVGGDQYEVNGRKWWSSGAGDPRCKVAIVMGVTNPDADRLHRHSMILVPLDAPGVKIIRPLSVFGYIDAPHGHMEILYDHVRVPASNLILGEGRGFEIAQGRLGPGRIHHCMRLIGVCERALEMMCQRAFARKAFGKRLIHQQTVRTAIAESRLEIDQARLLVLNAAHAIDTIGTKAARKQIAAIKVLAAQMSCRVIDRAIQLHGALGVSQDSLLGPFFSYARSLRIADGPDIVHLETVVKEELKEQKSKL